VRLSAAADPDTTDDLATVSVTAPGLSTAAIRASVLDLGDSSIPIFGNGFE
jgi:hypothetical protein